MLIKHLFQIININKQTPKTQLTQCKRNYNAHSPNEDTQSTSFDLINPFSGTNIYTHTALKYHLESECIYFHTQDKLPYKTISLYPISIQLAP